MPNTNYALYEIIENELHYYFFGIQILCGGRFAVYMVGVENYPWKTGTFLVAKAALRGQIVISKKYCSHRFVTIRLVNGVNNFASCRIKRSHYETMFSIPHRIGMEHHHTSLQREIWHRTEKI